MPGSEHENEPGGQREGHRVGADDRPVLAQREQREPPCRHQEGRGQRHALDAQDGGRRGEGVARDQPDPRLGPEGDDDRRQRPEQHTHVEHPLQRVGQTGAIAARRPREDREGGGHQQPRDGDEHFNHAKGGAEVARLGRSRHQRHEDLRDPVVEDPDGGGGGDGERLAGEPSPRLTLEGGQQRHRPARKGDGHHEGQHGTDHGRAAKKGSRPAPAITRSTIAATVPTWRRSSSRLKATSRSED